MGRKKKRESKPPVEVKETEEKMDLGDLHPTPLENTDPNFNYDHFINFTRDPLYFGSVNPEEVVKLAPSIRQFFLEKLTARPYETEEFLKLMEHEKPHLFRAFDYIQDNAKWEDEEFGYPSCKGALDSITEGIEVRVHDGNSYFGLKSKLDSA